MSDKATHVDVSVGWGYSRSEDGSKHRVYIYTSEFGEQGGGSKHTEQVFETFAEAKRWLVTVVEICGLAEMIDVSDALIPLEGDQDVTD